ncbi:MAG: LptA/OstA family protein [Kiritimatiellia bacterium]
MRRTAGILVVIAGIMAAAAPSALAQGVTEITSERLTFDYKEHYALFEENVVVTDPELKLKADRMTVHFSDANDVKSIIARGNVIIEQEDRIATAGRCVYDVESGKIQLDESPKVKRGKDMLEGTTITFWRDLDKMVCEPRARLVIYPQKGNAPRAGTASGE